LKKIATIISILVGFTIIAGAIFAVDNRYALKTKLNQLEIRFELSKKIDRKYAVQQRIWDLLKEFKKEGMPTPVLNEYRALKLELEEIKRQIQGLEKREVN